MARGKQVSFDFFEAVKRPQKRRKAQNRYFFEFSRSTIICLIVLISVILVLVAIGTATFEGYKRQLLEVMSDLKGIKSDFETFKRGARIAIYNAKGSYTYEMFEMQ